MLCLGIESSCDETGLALVDDGKVLDSVLSSQIDIHGLFGGVVPELASREHYRYIGRLFDELFARNSADIEDVDVIAATRGPGLLGSILVGIAFAKGLALSLGKKFLGIDHLHAHLLAVGLERAIVFPCLGLLISGGHTNLYRIESPCEFTCLGQTLDDAAGEIFDKVATALGFPYPGGKKIDDLAKNSKLDSSSLPRPYLKSGNLDFSFSGLKTAAINFIAKNGICQQDASCDCGNRLERFCADFNHAVADTLCAKVAEAFSKHPDLKCLVVAGGVAANDLIKAKMTELVHASGREILIPSKALCTDNALMIAHAAWLLAREGFFHHLDIEAIPRGRKIPDDLCHCQMEI